MPGLPADVLCTPIGLDASGGDLFMSSQGVGTGPDDDSSRKTTGGSSVASREKGRGSYRCGRVRTCLIIDCLIGGMILLTLYILLYENIVRCPEEGPRLSVPTETQASSR